MTDLLVRFSQESQQILAVAKHIARQSGQKSITPYHLLMAMLSLEDSAGARILHKFPFRMEQLFTRLNALIVLDAKKEDIAEIGYQDKHFVFSKTSTDILNAADAESRHRGFQFVDSQMLFLGMISLPNNPAGRILNQFGITTEAYRQHITDPQTSSRQKSFVYGAATQKRKEAPISPIFIGLLIAFAASGYMLYQNIGKHEINAFIFVIVGWIISLSLHEFGHALVAYIGGDTSVEDKGYLTLNPLRYTHTALSIVFPIIFLLAGGIPLPGGAVYINPRAIRTPFLRSLTSAAGPIGTLLFGMLLALPFITKIHTSTLETHTAFWATLAFLTFLQFFALVLNLLPFPGLDGFGILEPYLPETILRFAHTIRSFGFFLLIALIWYTPVGGEIQDLVSKIIHLIDKDMNWLVGIGYQLFQFWK